MGESVNEATTEARNVILSTIKESDLIKTNAWSHVEESKHETASRTEWSVNKKDTRFKPQPIGIKRNRPNAISNIELRRRNSDPATKVSGLVDDKVQVETSPNDLKPTPAKNLLEWKGDLFMLAEHQFRKIARFSKDDVCVCCHEKMDAFVTQVKSILMIIYLITVFLLLLLD